MGIMKKILLGCLLLLSACQTSTSTPAPAMPPTSTSTPPPSPVPATFTPEPTHTPAPSPTPFPRLFTDEFDAALAGWSVLQGGNESAPDVRTENGALLLQMDSPYAWFYTLYGAHTYADVRIDAQFTNRALTPASAGLLCRYSEEEGWFEFNVSTDGTYNVLFGRWLEVGVVEYLPIASGSSNAIQPSGATQTIGLVCSGTTLYLYVNDTLFRQLDVTNYDLTEGMIGLAASSYENTPIVVGFDWVTIREP